MALLVIGGSGYLGREIVRQSTAAGHRVTTTFLTRRPEVDGAEWLPSTSGTAGTSPRPWPRYGRT